MQTAAGVQIPVGERYLRVGWGVYPVYGDDLRGWSLRPDDFRGLAECSPYVYESVDELFFALVNLWAATRAEGRA